MTDQPLPDARTPELMRAHEMMATDAASRALGIELVDASAGCATVSMLVTDAMVNGLGVCHGGVVFTLADTAMAIASNSSGVPTLASAASIELLAPSAVGDRLRATCTEVIKPGRSAINDAVVTNQDGTVVAMFRGRTVSMRTSGSTEAG